MEIRTLITRGYNLWKSSTVVSDTCFDNVGTILQIWNGTGVLDTGTDWKHIGIGIEDQIAAYQGTNGLLVSNVQKSGEVTFFRQNEHELNINDYNFLSFWINITKWKSNADIYIKLFSSITNIVKILRVSDYVLTKRLSVWQRGMIPLQRFMIKCNINEKGCPTYVNTLTFIVDEGVDFYIDNITLIMGEVVLVAVCEPDIDTQGQSNKFLHYSPELDTYKVRTITDVPNISTQKEYTIEGDLIPNMDVEKVNKNGGLSPSITTFPQPLNL